MNYSAGSMEYNNLTPTQYLLAKLLHIYTENQLSEMVKCIGYGFWIAWICDIRLKLKNNLLSDSECITEMTEIMSMYREWNFA
jgi:hypothetical protein